jgi:hypothetical protein
VKFPLLQKKPSKLSKKDPGTGVYQENTKIYSRPTLQHKKLKQQEIKQTQEVKRQIYTF